MLLKITGVTLLFISSSMFGYVLSSEFSKRIKVVEKFYKSLINLRGEINYNNSGIKEAVETISSDKGTVEKFYIAVLRIFEEKETSINAAWKLAIKQELETVNYIKKDELLIIKELGENIGITDRETQINNINYAMDKLSRLMQELKASKTSKCKIYRMMGIVTGMFVAIILI